MTETADKLFNIGKLNKSIRMLQKSINIHDALMGKGADFFDHVLEILHSKAIDFLNAGDVESSLKILRKSEFMIRKRGRNQSTRTKVENLNNLSIWYRKRGEFQIALEYIDKAICVCSSENYPPGRSYLNCGAIYSVLGKHFLAIENTKLAIKSLKRELIKAEDKHKREIARMIVLAFYNVSVLEDNLDQYA